ncbi:hypothetical protein HanPSC8_Chr03g0086301 [Helianthus annuus]|nr:hypothetical protein HanPSC8_Chr03g0086301 [Helianthus annuus]
MINGILTSKMISRAYLDTGVYSEVVFESVLKLKWTTIPLNVLNCQH